MLESKLAPVSNKLISSIRKKSITTQEDMINNLREEFSEDAKEIFVPPEVVTMFDTFRSLDEGEELEQESILEETFKTVLNFFKQKLEKYKTTRVFLSTCSLLDEWNLQGVSSMMELIPSGLFIEHNDE